MTSLSKAKSIHDFLFINVTILPRHRLDYRAALKWGLDFSPATNVNSKVNITTPLCFEVENGGISHDHDLNNEGIYG